MGKDQFGDGRLKGQCLRWHVGRGLKKPGCKFCYPNGDGPVVPPEPLSTPITISEPPTITAQPEKLDSESRAKQAHLRDQIWAFAGNATDLSVVSKLLNMQLQALSQEIFVLYGGLSYPELCELAMQAGLNDLQTSALRRAKQGDFRGIQILERSGLMPMLKYAAGNQESTTSRVRKMTDEDLQEWINTFVGERGISLPSPTVRLETPENVEAATTEWAKGAEPVRVKSPEPTPATESHSVTRAEREIVEPVIEPLPEPVVVCMDIPQGEQKPVIARPKGGQLVIRERGSVVREDSERGLVEYAR